MMTAWLICGSAHAQKVRDLTPDEVTKRVHLDQKLNAQIPLDLEFRDEAGKRVRLHEYFRGKPVMLNLIQYRCTMLCSREMEALAESLKELTFTVGKEFTLITLSIDHREQPSLAKEYQEGYLKQYGRPGAAEGWHFLTGDEGAIARLADAIGFRFVYVAKTDQYAHPDGVMILTPEGKVSHYFFNLRYPPRDLRLGLVEAAARRIGSPLDMVALLCYHYNPATGKYNLALLGVLRLAAAATLLSLGGAVTVWSLRGRSGRGRNGPFGAGRHPHPHASEG
jgi:protein SCO1/2